MRPLPVPYRSRPIKLRRRTPAEIESIRAAVAEVLADYNPMTVRQVFCQLVSRGVITKMESYISHYRNDVRHALAVIWSVRPRVAGG